MPRSARHTMGGREVLDAKTMLDLLEGSASDGGPTVTIDVDVFKDNFGAPPPRRSSLSGGRRSSSSGASRRRETADPAQLKELLKERDVLRSKLRGNEDALAKLRAFMEDLKKPRRMEEPEIPPAARAWKAEVDAEVACNKATMAAEHARLAARNASLKLLTRCSRTSRAAVSGSSALDRFSTLPTSFASALRARGSSTSNCNCLMRLSTALMISS